ncbi:MAG TPA: division plane positioning ATPase MipZ, partial [Xanthobacteraceae bacterium]|nr:division plane positioning ATPase MipZ [Xanthobacteraceae bacterium]
MLLQAPVGLPRSAHVIVLGNEKGGSGKSTTSMHIAVALMKVGQRVATIDLDSRQRSFTHYVENRR